MHSCMQADPVHDTGHIYRVLYHALHIAATEPQADRDIVVLAALLHDIGRGARLRYPGMHHAEAGGEMACDFLLAAGWGEPVAFHVRECIRSHSYSAPFPPITIEAQILCDADRLDLTGAVGTARAIGYGARDEEPLYTLAENGMPQRGKKDEGRSLLREYRRKLRRLHKQMYTAEGARLARKNRWVMRLFFDALQDEIITNYRQGLAALQKELR